MSQFLFPATLSMDSTAKANAIQYVRRSISHVGMQVIGAF
jgi:hypothetical protein